MKRWPLFRSKDFSLFFRSKDFSLAPLPGMGERLKSLLPSLGPARHLWRLLSFQPWTYLLVIVTKLFFITLLPHATGLLTRQYFDGLIGKAPMIWGINGVVWLLIGIGVARAVTTVADVVGNRLFRHPLGALLRKNLLTHLFSRPAAQALTVSPGEAVSRLRDDVIVTINMLYTTTFLVANLLFALIAIVIMVRIDLWVTLLVFDDLSSALDVETETHLWTRLLSQSPRPTCLAVSHRPLVLQRADQILVIKEGCVSLSPAEGQPGIRER